MSLASIFRALHIHLSLSSYMTKESEVEGYG